MIHFTRQKLKDWLGQILSENIVCISPKKTLKILECIVSCIDMPTDGTTHNNCMIARHVFCEKKQRPNLHCYYFLVFELITHLRAVEGQMDHRAKAYDIYRELENHPKKCK